jgi:hypothetical protein
MRKEDVLNQTPLKLFVNTESLESSSHVNREFVTNPSTLKHLTSNYQLDIGDTRASEWNNGVSKTPQQAMRCTRQFNQNDSNKAEPVVQVSEVDGNKSQADQMADCEVNRGHSKEESLNARQKGDVQQPEEADYEDASDGDNVSVNLIMLLSNHM